MAETLEDWEARDRATRAARRLELRREWRRYHLQRAATWRALGEERAAYHERRAAGNR